MEFGIMDWVGIGLLIAGVFVVLFDKEDSND